MSHQLKWVLQCYGFLAPKHKRLTASDFIEQIELTYDCSGNNPNRYACQVLECFPNNIYYFDHAGNCEVRS